MADARRRRPTNLCAEDPCQAQRFGTSNQPPRTTYRVDVVVHAVVQSPPDGGPLQHAAHCVECSWGLGTPSSSSSSWRVAAGIDHSDLCILVVAHHLGTLYGSPA